MAQDEEFLNAVETLIRNNQLSAETAYEFKALELRNLWSGAARLRERLADLHAIQLRMINRLLGRSGPDISAMTSDDQVIVVAHELSPGLTVQLDREHVVGLVSEEGTRTAHAAILAHSLGIPAVMGAVRRAGHDSRTAPCCCSTGRAARSCSTPPATSWRRPRPSSAAATSSSCSSRAWWISRRSPPAAARSCSWATWTCPRRSSRPSGWARRAWACCAPSSS